jgi:membrane protein DedA with SNARE-associated domain
MELAEGDPMNSTRSYVPYLVGAIVVFAVGLAIGYSQGDDPTFLNSVSKVLLTVGFLAVIVTGALQLMTRVRAARSRP